MCQDLQANLQPLTEVLSKVITRDKLKLVPNRERLGDIKRQATLAEFETLEFWKWF
jgi:hypothetical protein